jgi:hypothetical protein
MDLKIPRSSLPRWQGSLRHRLVAALCCLLFAHVLTATAAPIPTDKPKAYPGWWFARGVIPLNNPANPPAQPSWKNGDYPAPSDFGPANLGQLKHIASKAAAEMNATLPGFQNGNGAGDAVNALVNAWSQPLPPDSNVTRDDFSTLNLGQLKAVAKVFYDRLKAVHYTNIAPWEAAVLAADDFGVANLGQLKAVFSFDAGYSSTGDGIPDWWALQFYGTTVLNTSDPDGLGDGLSILGAYEANEAPDFFHGITPVLNLISGWNQTVPPGATFPGLVTIRVTSNGFTPIPYAPVLLTTNAGAISLTGDRSTGTTQLWTTADVDGYVTFTVFAPNYMTQLTITATAGSGSLAVPEMVSDESQAFAITPSPAQLENYPTPTVAAASRSGFAANAAFHEFANPVMNYYTVKTTVEHEDLSVTDSHGNQDRSVGDINSVANIDPLKGVITYTFDPTSVTNGVGVGMCTLTRTYVDFDSGHHLQDVTTAQQDTTTGDWTGTTVRTDFTTPGTSSFPFAGPGSPVIVNLTNVVSPTVLGPTNSSFTGSITLSKPYGREQLLDVARARLSAYTGVGSALGTTLAYITADNSSVSLEDAQYQWTVSQAFPAPNPTWSWFEVFSTATNPPQLTATRKSWSGVGAALQSPIFTIDASQSTQNGIWYLAQILISENVISPRCNYRDVVGAGEVVNLSLAGLPQNIGAVTWTVSTDSMGNPMGTLAGASGNQVSFTAGVEAGSVTVTATVGGATFSQDLTIKVPTGIVQQNDWAPSSPVFSRGQAGAQMYLVTTILPTDVSFWNLQISEGPTPAVPAGSGPDYDPNPFDMPGQPVDPNTRNWINLWQDNREIRYDVSAVIGPVDPSSPPNPYFDPTYPTGSASWNIPWYYKLSTDNAGLGTLFVPQVPLSVSLDPQTGLAKVQKSGQSAQRTPKQ